jgi:hypothetical protein
MWSGYVEWLCGVAMWSSYAVIIGAAGSDIKDFLFALDINPGSEFARLRKLWCASTVVGSCTRSRSELERERTTRC